MHHAINSTSNRQGGFMKYIIVFAVLAAALAYFGISAADIIESQPVQAAWRVAQNLWVDYASPALAFLWERIIVGFLWEGIAEFFGDVDIDAEPAGSATGTPIQNGD